MAYTTIKVSEAVKRRLLKIAGELEADRGKKVSLNEVIEILIESYELRRKRGLRMADFDSLMIDLDEDASERLDDVVYRQVGG